MKQNERILLQLRRARTQETQKRLAPEMTVNVVMEARSILKKGGAPGDDKVAVEMIMALPVAALYHFAELFRARYDGGTQMPVDRWADIVQSFLPKDDKTQFMFDLRGISLLSAMLKWYTNGLVIMAEEDELLHPVPREYETLATFGYVEGMSCQQITETLRILMSKCHEWQDRAALVLGTGDVLMAFDHMKPEVVAEAMTRRQMHGKLAAAFLREGRELKMHVKFQNVTKNIQVPLNKCEKTGSTDAAFKWKIVTEDVYAVLANRWEALGFGVQIDRCRFTHLIWADNWYTLASNVAMLTRMLKDLTSVMLSRGLYWKEKSLELMTALLNAPENLTMPFPFPMGNEIAPHPEKVTKVIPLEGSTIKPNMKALTPTMIGQLKIPRVEQSKQLGVLLDSKGSSGTSWMHRKRLAIKALWAERGLCTSVLPRGERLDRFAEVMPASLIYGCEGWSLSKTLLLNIHQCEGNLLRTTARIPKEARDICNNICAELLGPPEICFVNVDIPRA